MNDPWGVQRSHKRLTKGVLNTKKKMTSDELKVLYQKYLDILELEVNQFGCKTTEVRHLIGRIGEFYCALNVNGTLAQVPNQHGFDVIDKDGYRISVKTTAQKSGFVSLNKNTLDRFDKLMVIQIINLIPEIIYFDNIKNLKLLKIRVYGQKLEFDINRAKKNFNIKTDS
jgi:hypothetical protein